MATYEEIIAGLADLSNTELLSVKWYIERIQNPYYSNNYLYDSVGNSEVGDNLTNPYFNNNYEG